MAGPIPIQAEAVPGTPQMVRPWGQIDLSVAQVRIRAHGNGVVVAGSRWGRWQALGVQARREPDVVVRCEAPARVSASSSARVGDLRPFGFVGLSGRVQQGRAGVAVELAAELDDGLLDQIVRFACAYVLPRRGGLFLHASAVRRSGRLWLFAGPSGAGKTTVAQELAGGGTAVAVDRVGLLRAAEPGGWEAHGTPMSDACGALRPEPGARPQGILFLVQAPRPRLVRLGLSEATRALMAHSVVSHPTGEVMARVLDAAAGVARQVPCFRLEFSRDEGFWRLLDGVVK